MRRPAEVAYQPLSRSPTRQLSSIRQVAAGPQWRCGSPGCCVRAGLMSETYDTRNLTREEAVEVGSAIGALIGLGIEGDEGAKAGARLGAEAAADDGVEVLSDEPA